MVHQSATAEVSRAVLDLATPPFVLTLNPDDLSSKELLAFVVSACTPVYVSPVRELGFPQLRVSPGQYIFGSAAILAFLQHSSR